LKENVMPNPFVHVELHTNDVPAARKFYSSLFGWQLQDMPMPDGKGTYTMINVGEGTGGGMMQNPEPNAPPQWLAMSVSTISRHRRGAPRSSVRPSIWASPRSVISAG
jgi:predicted enzyme related to lactoylglutathione lyase